MRCAVASWPPSRCPWPGFLIVAGCVARLLPPAADLVSVQRGVGRRRPRRRSSSRSACSSPRSRSCPRASSPGSSPSPRSRVITAGVVSAARGERTDRAALGGARGARAPGSRPTCPPARSPTRPPRSPRERADGPPHPPPLARSPCWSRWAWPSAACADDAPLDTLDPKGPEAQTIHNLVVPVFVIAGVVFVLVAGRRALPRLAVPQAQGRRRQPAAAGARQHQARAGLDDPPRPRCSPASAPPRCSPCSTSTTARRTRSRSTVIGQQWWWEYRYDVDGDGEDDIVTANDLVIPAGEPVTLIDHVARRHPLVLDPGPERQEGRRARAQPSRSPSRPTSPASTAGSAPSSAVCPTPTCACASWRCPRPTTPTGRRGSWRAPRCPTDELAKQGMELFRTTVLAVPPRLR